MPRFCTQCGTENPDDSNFCRNCGALLPASTPAGATASAGTPGDGFAAGRQDDPEASWAPEGSVPAGASAGGDASAAAPAFTGDATQGAAGAAWSDVTHTPAWAGRLALAGLAGIVPILNFAVGGYAYRWGAELLEGRHQPMPKRIVTGPNFKTGACIFLVNLVVTVLIAVAGALIEAVLDIIGLEDLTGFLTIVLSVLIMPFAAVASLRIAATGRLGAGFKVGRVVELVRRRYGSLLVAMLLPSLIMGLIAFAIASALTIAFLPGIIMGGMALAANAYGMYGHNYGYGYGYGYDYGYGYGAEAMGNILSLLGGVFMYLLVVYIATMFLMAIANVILGRSAGFWAARFAPDLAADAAAPTGYIPQAPAGDSAPAGAPATASAPASDAAPVAPAADALSPAEASAPAEAPVAEGPVADVASGAAVSAPEASAPEAPAPVAEKDAEGTAGVADAAEAPAVDTSDATEEEGPIVSSDDASKDQSGPFA